MISPEQIENAIDRGRIVLRFSKFIVPGAAGIVLVATTIDKTPVISVPLSVAMLALVALFGLGYLAGRTADDNGAAVAEITARPRRRAEHGQDDETGEWA